MKHRDDTLEAIAADFAEAVADGDFARAEGWLAAALLAAARLGTQRQRQ